MKNEIFDVYISPMPRICPEDFTLAHKERNREISEISNAYVKCEKFFSWRLLELALTARFQKNTSELLVTREESGKWISPFCFLSLSHTKAALAVAVSSYPVGVDIEREVPPRAKNFAERVLTEREMKMFSELEPEERGKHLCRLWSMKEALFKKNDARTFVPKTLDTEFGVVCSDYVLGGEKIFLSLASDKLPLANIIVISPEEL